MGFLICAECGERDSFRQEVRRYISETGTNYLDGYGDFLEFDYSDSDVDDEENIEDIRCCECDSPDVLDFETEEERDDFIKKHTLKDGEWSEDEITLKDKINVIKKVEVE